MIIYYIQFGLHLDRVVTKVWGFSTASSLFLKAKHFLYRAEKGEGEGGGGRHCFSKCNFSFRISCFWIALPELVKAKWSVGSFKSRGFSRTPHKGWFYAVNECPAAEVQFHGVSKLWCKGAFPSLQIQKNLNMKYENERTARLCGSCGSEGNAFVGNSIFLLEKRMEKKERTKLENIPQRRPILWFGFFLKFGGIAFL